MRKILKQLHLDNPNYENGLKDKDKLGFKYLKELFYEKYNFD